tara:strand:+ start:902 stop:1018 length:117 start_codon:yes stop_codon:yes gene_type:complete
MIKSIVKKILNIKSREDLDAKFWIQKLLLKRSLNSLKY